MVLDPFEEHCNLSLAHIQPLRNTSGRESSVERKFEFGKTLIIMEITTIIFHCFEFQHLTPRQSRCQEW